MILGRNLGAHLAKGFNCSVAGLLHALTEYHGICACFQVLHTFIDHCLSKDSSCGGTVTGHVIGLCGNFLYKLCAHVLELVLKLDLLCNGNTVVGDKGCAIGLVKDHVPSLGSQSNSDGIRQLINTGFKSGSGLRAIFDFFSHLIHLL